MKPKIDLRSPLFKWAVPVLLLALLLAHAWYYMPFYSDDALISLRYAQRLLQGQGLTWTEGPPVEGYSNLMWIFLVSLLGALGMNLLVASRVLGVLCMGGAVAFVSAWYLRFRRRTAPPAGLEETDPVGGRSLPGLLVGLLFFVGVAPVAVWTIGGLEQPLIAACLAGAIPLYWMAAAGDFKKRSVAFWLSALLGVLCLTRPDGPLFTVAVLGSALLHCAFTRRRWSWSFALIVVSIPVLLYGGQLVFRLAYYGAWVPNSALVKYSPSLHHLIGGLEYVWKGILALAPASFLALAFLVVGTVHPRSRARFLPLLLLTVLWLGYVVVIGGDVFAAYRHFIPLVVVWCYALAEGAALLWEWLKGRTARRAVLFGGLVVVAALTFLLQFDNPQSERALGERWELYGRSLGVTLKEAFADERPLLAVTAAGCLPYWSELPCLDMLGLNDYYLPRHKPADMGEGVIGHELGDTAYVLKRAPDLIVFHVGSEPNYRYGYELAASGEFRRRYTKMQVRTALRPVYTALVWFRVDSERIGVERCGDGLRIPAYLMNAFEGTTAFLYDGRLVVGVKAGCPVGLAIDYMPGVRGVEVVSRYSGLIECTTERVGDGVDIVLSTQSEELLPVEAIVVKM